MVNLAVALLATLAAFAGAGLLVARTLPDWRRFHLIAWTLTLVALGIALAGLTIGYAAGFGPALLRTLELFAGLLAPLSLPLGLVEFVARTVQARFAARLIAASYVIVAVVILLLDPIIGTFGKSMPTAGGHYSSLPGLVLDGAHLFAVVSLVSCVVVIALRANKRDHWAQEIMLTVAFVALAGVLVVAAMRGYLPGPLAPLALGGAATLVWFGASRILTPRAHGDDDYDDEEPEPYVDPYADRYQGDMPPGRQPSFAPPAGPPGLPGQYGRITIYTLIDGHEPAFDRLAADVCRAVRESDHGTLVYTCHSVDNSPNQRIFYQLFRDAAAVERHTRQPHIQRFAGEARAHVSGTNVLELTVNAGLIAAMAGQPPAGPQSGGYHQPGRTGEYQQPGGTGEYQQPGRTGGHPRPAPPPQQGPPSGPYPQGRPPEAPPADPGRPGHQTGGYPQPNDPRQGPRPGGTNGQQPPAPYGQRPGQQGQRPGGPPAPYGQPNSQTGPRPYPGPQGPRGPRMGNTGPSDVPRRRPDDPSAVRWPNG